MADAAAARREARKRRILENSQSRLQLISGKNCSEPSKASLISPFLDAEVLPDCVSSKDNAEDIISSNSNGSIPSETSLLGLNADVRGINLPSYSAGDLGDKCDIFQRPSTESSNVSQPSNWEKLVQWKYDLILLSIFHQIMYAYGAASIDTFYFFLPVAVYTVTKILFLPSKQQSNIANMLLLLNGMSPDRVQKISRIVTILGKFSHDVCLVLFTTICIRGLLSFVLGEFY